ncbi:MAG: DNA replication and repair protein RecF [Algoriphagus sp.]
MKILGSRFPIANREQQNDIFDKLDDLRIAQLMQLISKHTFGQIFLTDARPERSKKILGGLDGELRFFEIRE